MDKLSKPVCRRVLLKLSGEALQGDHLFGVDPSKLIKVAQEVISMTQMGVQVALVVGGGNLIRGADLCSAGFDRVSADQMGMLATVINGLSLRDAILNQGAQATLMSSIAIPSVAEQYNRVRARELLDQNHIVICAGGTGNPLVTTDSAAALRGIEISADLLLKATKVDGVFDDDPVKNPKAICFKELTYNEVVEKRLGVMDLNAILLCQDHELPVRVFNMNKQGALNKILAGEDIGTLIRTGE